MAGLTSEAQVTIDEDGKIIEVKGDFQKIFGWKNEEMTGQSVQVLIPYKYREQHIAGFGRWRKTGEKRAMGTWMAVEGKHHNGNIFPITMVLTERVIGQRRIVTAYFETKKG